MAERGETESVKGSVARNEEADRPPRARGAGVCNFPEVWRCRESAWVGAASGAVGKGGAPGMSRLMMARHELWLDVLLRGRRQEELLRDRERVVAVHVEPPGVVHHLQETCEGQARGADKRRLFRRVRR